MLSKTRTTIITLVAAFSFGGAAIVPTVAQARIKIPAGWSHARYCSEQLKGYHEALDLAAEAAPGSATRADFVAIAGGFRANARAAGCLWAGRVATPEGGTPPTNAPEPSGTPAEPPRATR